MTKNVLTLRDILTKTNVNPAFIAPKSGDFGIEVEVEYLDTVKNLLTQDWITKNDGSLRYHGREYVSPGPIPKERVEGALDFLCKKINKGPVINDSPRTSVHVHRNVLDLTMTQIWTVCMAYWLLEETLFKLCGPGREQNLFCLRMKDAQGLKRTVENELTLINLPTSSLYRADHIRYAGLNLCAIPLFGSIEFRGMAGIYNAEYLTKWVMVLDTLVVNAYTKFASPRDILAKMYDLGVGWLISELLGPYEPYVRSFDPTDMDRRVVSGAINLLDFGYNTDWLTFEEAVFKRVSGVTSWRDRRPRPLRNAAEIAEQFARVMPAHVNEALAFIEEDRGDNGL